MLVRAYESNTPGPFMDHDVIMLSTKAILGKRNTTIISAEDGQEHTCEMSKLQDTLDDLQKNKSMFSCEEDYKQVPSWLTC
jgi:hypothetical protein